MPESEELYIMEGLRTTVTKDTRLTDEEVKSGGELGLPNPEAVERDIARVAGGEVLNRKELWAWYLYGIASFKQTCADVWQLPETFKFLVGWFLLADSMNTVNTVTSLFAQTVLNMDENLLGVAILIAPVFSMVGAYGFFFIHEKWNIRTKTLILVDCAMCMLLGVYVMVGFGTTKWGFNNAAELFPIVAYFGIVNGATIALTRAQFVELCPPGMEAEMFSLFRVTDKGSAFIGPLVAAGINTATHNLRFAYVWCFALFIASGVFFYWFDPKKGREQAQAMSTLVHLTDDEFEGRTRAFL
ncbi:Autophagy protein 22 [Dipsacomyces acuminosporus]|nr:Autophagy protein 22 [Dipsacomyces acuminosporus]